MDDTPMTATPVTPPSDSDSPSSSTLNISSANLNPSTSLPAASADDSFDLSDSEMADDSALASAPQAIDASSGSDNDADVAEESTTAPSASGQAGAGPSKRVRGLRPPGGPKGKLGGASSGAGGGMFGRLTGWGNKGKGRAEKDDGAGGGGGLGLSSGGAGGGGGGLREEREKLVDEDEMDALNRDIGDIFDESALDNLSRQYSPHQAPLAGAAETAETALPVKSIA